MPEDEGHEHEHDHEKDESDADEKPTKKEKSGGEKSEKSGEKGTEQDSLRAMIREEISSLLSDEHARPNMRRVDLETQAEKLVETAVARLNAKNEHDAEHERLRTGQIEEKPPPAEQTPIKSSRLRKALWGEQ